MAEREKKPVAMGRSWLNVLTTVPLLHGLSKRHLGRIADLATHQRFSAHTDLVRSGEPGTSFFVILDGTATVRRTGRRAAKLGPGEFFGEMAVLDGAERTATVTSDTDIEVMVIGRKDLLRLVETEPKLAVGMLTSMASRLRAAQSSASD